MLLVFFIGLLFVAVQAAPSRRQFGICVEMCSTTGSNSCPAGFECRSNGCGHTCHPIILKDRRQFGACVEMCSPSGSGLLGSCGAGYECKSNGCGHTCHPISTGTLNKNCPGVLCALYCPSGFAKNANGCETCTCNTGQAIDLQKLFGTLG